MSEAAGVRGVVLAHGLLAEGLVDAARRITGVGEDALVAHSNRGLSPEAFVEQVRQLLGSGPGVIFTDLPSGSCYMAARRLHREGVRLVVISGVNLAILLDFIMHRDLPLAELGPRLLEKGRAAIGITPFDPALHAHPALSDR